MLQHVFKCCLSALTQPHNRFATRLLSFRWYVVRSQPRNPLFSCVKSLLLLWKPHSWF